MSSVITPLNNPCMYGTGIQLPQLGGATGIIGVNASGYLYETNAITVSGIYGPSGGSITFNPTGAINIQAANTTSSVPGSLLLGPTGSIIQGGTEYRGPTFSSTFSEIFEYQGTGPNLANLAVIGIPNNSVMRLDTEIQAQRTVNASGGASGGAADWKLSMAWQNINGTVSGMRSAVLVADSDGTNAGGAPTGWGVTMSASGTNAFIQGQGASGTFIDWSVLTQFRVTQ